MKGTETVTLPTLAFAGGTKAITLTPIVGTPERDYAEVFVPGEEPLADGELRVTVLGSGNPWPTRAQVSAGILVEVGNPERDLLVFDLGTGSLANFASLKLPVNKLNKVLSHICTPIRASKTKVQSPSFGFWLSLSRPMGAYGLCHAFLFI
jgi:hypothetical protein